MKQSTKEAVKQTAQEVLPEATMATVLAASIALNADPGVAVVGWQALTQYRETTPKKVK